MSFPSLNSTDRETYTRFINAVNSFESEIRHELFSEIRPELFSDRENYDHSNQSRSINNNSSKPSGFNIENEEQSFLKTIKDCYFFVCKCSPLFFGDFFKKRNEKLQEKGGNISVVCIEELTTSDGSKITEEIIGTVSKILKLNEREEKENRYLRISLVISLVFTGFFFLASRNIKVHKFNCFLSLVFSSIPLAHYQAYRYQENVYLSDIETNIGNLNREKNFKTS